MEKETEVFLEFIDAAFRVTFLQSKQLYKSFQVTNLDLQNFEIVEASVRSNVILLLINSVNDFHAGFIQIDHPEKVYTHRIGKIHDSKAGFWDDEILAVRQENDDIYYWFLKLDDLMNKRKAEEQILENLAVGIQSAELIDDRLIVIAETKNWTIPIWDLIEFSQQQQTQAENDRLFIKIIILAIILFVILFLIMIKVLATHCKNWKKYLTKIGAEVKILPADEEKQLEKTFFINHIENVEHV
uniref:Uncharacterized protein n=1 Tax=Panagrolaimus sp. JU765 TaxID=591449 RepID=A0AC34RFU7_9BILA